MGKGDIKSRKGKIARGSYGVTRPRVIVKAPVPKPEAEPQA
ncbi:30S ribosomal protein THX [Spirosoma flavum]|uniref:30S ribosomal protein THX n=1 Tax=Spirosoma flavum TaxID=2048557 RepID=A0ABW6AHM1_9BACT